MKFLIDSQLPPALARFICEDLRGEALHTADAGLRDASDNEVWEYAANNNLVLVSKDADFVTMFSKTFSGRLLWVRLGNCRRIVLLKVFEQQWERILGRFEDGERFVELR